VQIQREGCLAGEAWHVGDVQGKVVAKEVNEIVAKKVSKKGKEMNSGARENPGLVFDVWDEGMDPLLVDLMVVVWCAKTWCAETFEARIVKPTYYG
jgi:hypothetical protein